MVSVALMLAMAQVVVVQCWLNEYDQPVHFQCPTGQFLSHINSMHDNSHEDRVWDYGCRAIPVAGPEINCAWTNDVNDWDMPVTFQCPNNGYVTGMASHHDNGREDRRFSFQCCETQGTIVHTCFFTGWENDYDGILDYFVPNGKILRGMESVHDNGKEDRLFKFEICDISRRS